MWDAIAIMVRLPISVIALLALLIGMPLLLLLAAILSVFAVGLLIFCAAAAVVTNQPDALPEAKDFIGALANPLKGLAHPFVVIWEFQTLKRRWLWE